MNDILDDKPFKFDINLQRYTFVKVATLLWGHPEAGKKIDSCFDKTKATWQIHESKFEAYDLVIRNSQSLGLPEKMLHELRSYIVWIGDKTYNWKQFVTNELGFEVSMAETRWNNHGLIKEKEVFKSWEKNVCYEQVEDLMIRAACILAEEEFVVSHLEAIMSKLDIKYNPDIHKVDIHYIMFLWMADINQYLLNSRRPSWLIRLIKLVQCGSPVSLLHNEGCSRDIIVTFKKFLYQGYIHYVKYFWEKITQNEKSRIIRELKGDLYRYLRSASNLPFDFNYHKEKIVEAVIFIMNNATDDERGELIKQTYEYLFLEIFSVWPFQEFFTDILNDSKSYLPSFESGIFHSILSVSNYLKNPNENKFIFYKSIYHQSTLAILWESMTLSLKEIVISDDLLYLRVRKACNIEIIKLIMNDRDLKNDRLQILERCKKMLRSGLKNGEFDFCSKFLNEILSEDEKAEFKSQLNVIESLVLSGKIELADKVLNFLSSSDNERIEIRNKLDVFKICDKMINLEDPDEDEEDERSYDSDDSYEDHSAAKKAKEWRESVDEFLNWQFSQPEEIQKIKLNFLNSPEIIHKKIYKLFSGYSYISNVNEGESHTKLGEKKEKCMELLEWLLGSKKQADKFFKNDLGKNVEFLRKYLYEVFQNDLVDEYSLLPLPQTFLEFFSVPSDVIVNLKEKIQENINDWVDILMANDNLMEKFEMVNEFILWVSINKRNKENLIRDLVNSTKGIWLYKEIFESLVKNCNFDDCLLFLNSWVKPFAFLGKFETDLVSLEGIDAGKKRDMIELLSKLKRKKRLNQKDLDKYAADAMEEVMEEVMNALMRNPWDSDDYDSDFMYDYDFD